MESAKEKIQNSGCPRFQDLVAVQDLVRFGGCPRFGPIWSDLVAVQDLQDLQDLVQDLVQDLGKRFKLSVLQWSSACGWFFCLAQ